MSPGALRREIALGAALALLVSLGWWFYRTQETSFRNQVEAELVAVGHLKVDQLTDWRRERLGDGAALASNPFFRTAVPDWIRRPSSPSGELLRSLETLRRHYRYEDILLTDPGGRVLWSFGASRKVLAPAAREVLASGAAGPGPSAHGPARPRLPPPGGGGALLLVLRHPRRSPGAGPGRPQDPLPPPAVLAPPQRHRGDPAGPPGGESGALPQRSAARPKQRPPPADPPEPGRPARRPGDPGNPGPPPGTGLPGRGGPGLRAPRARISLVPGGQDGSSGGPGGPGTGRPG